MNLETLKLFCEVAEHRSISRAAAQAGITQSAASQRLMALEKELAVRLLDRSTRPVQLTAAGELFHRGGRDLLDRYEKLRRQVSAMAQAVPLTGEVRIAAIYSSGIDLLNQVEQDFSRLQPHCRIHVEYQQPEIVHDRLLHDQADLGIISYPRRWRGLAWRPLRDEMMVLVCRPDHELAGHRCVHVSQLAGRPLAMFDRHLPISRHLAEYFRQARLSPHITCRFDNVDTIKTCVGQTDALAILPGRTVRREIQQGLLAAVRLDPTPMRPIAIVYRKGRELPPAVQAFIDYLIQHQPQPFELPPPTPEKISAAPANASKP